MELRCPHCERLFAVEAALEIVDVLTIGRLTVDVSKGLAAVDGVVQHLTLHEWELLKLLAGARGGLVSNYDLGAKLYGDATDWQGIRVLVGRLRAKIPNGYIQTHNGRGYLLAAP